MSSYIDADKLQKDSWKLYREKHGMATSTFETMELDCVPAADVVAVVRCKECKYYRPSLCEIFSKFGTIQTKENDYCSYAERAGK